MNNSRYVLASVVAFVYFFAAEFVFHGVILSETYENLQGIAHLARPEALFMWFFVAYLVLGFVITYVFVRGYENKGLGEGVRFGLILGILIGVPNTLIRYAVEPWPGDIVVTFMVGYIIEYLIGGVLIALLYKPKTA